MISDAELLRKYKKDKAAAMAGLKKTKQNIEKCRAFYNGNYMDYVDSVQFRDQRGSPKRMLVQINKIKPYVNALKGHMIQNRRKPRYVAHINDEAEQIFYSSGANNLSDYHRQNAFADTADAEVDEDMLVGGIGCSDTALSYGDGYASTDVNGDIIIAAHDIMDCWWDPSAARKNIIDRRFEGVTKRFDLDEALDLFSGSEEKDFNDGEDSNSGDEGYEYDPSLGGSYDRIRYDWCDYEARQINVDFYNWYEIQTYYRADNPLKNFTTQDGIIAAQNTLVEIADRYGFDPASEHLSVPKEAKKELEDAFENFIQLEPFKRKVFYSAIISGKTVFDKQKAICQQTFPLKFKTGDRDKNNNIWIGVVNSMMEPAIYYSKALTEFMFVIAANSKGGAFVEEDAVDDIAEFEAAYARTDGIVIVRSGSLAQGKIQPKKQAFAPTGYEQVVAFSDQNFEDVSGIDRSFLGSSENKVEPATLQRQRVRQVMTGFANYVDSISLYQQEHARLMLDYMRVWAENNEGAMYKILGEDGAIQFSRVSADMLNAEFSVEIQDAPQTPDEKSDNADMLLQIAQSLIALNDPAGKVILSKAVKYMNIDSKDAIEISQILAPKQDQVDPAYVQQLEQMVQQLQDTMTQAQIDSLRAKTELDRAKIPQIMVDMQKVAAETKERESMSEQTDIENTILRHTGQKNIDIHT